MNTATGNDRTGNTVTVKLGDSIGFKSDIEQRGRIVAIRRNQFGATMLTLENDSGFSGDYLAGETETTEWLGDCWAD